MPYHAMPCHAMLYCTMLCTVLCCVISYVYDYTIELSLFSWLFKDQIAGATHSSQFPEIGREDTASGRELPAGQLTTCSQGTSLQVYQRLIIQGVEGCRLIISTKGSQFFY